MGLTYYVEYLLVDLLPFWRELFGLLAAISWPLSLILIVRFLQPFISVVLRERGFSFEGFGARIQFEERKASQIQSGVPPENAHSVLSMGLPRTAAIMEREANLRRITESLPSQEVLGIALNALAIEQLEKLFALAYIDIFGSQIVFLQKINERGGIIGTKDGEDFLSEVKAKFPELEDWDFEKYTHFLVQRGFLRKESSIELTPSGRDFIQFIVRYGLRTDKPL